MCPLLVMSVDKKKLDFKLNKIMDFNNTIFKYGAQKIMDYKKIITYCILALITLVVYLQSLYYPFQFDDLPNIVNYTVLKVVSLKSICFTHSRWVCTWLNSLLYQKFQSNPVICRLININIHIATGALVFWLILQLKPKFKKDSFYIATITTALFLLHPVQTQTISYVIQGQLEGLSSLFILLAILSFFSYVHTAKLGLKILNFWSLFTFLILASSTKEIAIITPFLILLVDWFLIAAGNFKNLKNRLWLHLSLFVTTFTIYTYYLKPDFLWKLITWQHSVTFSNGNLLTNNGNLAVNQYQFLISQFKVILHYLWIFIWPLNICIEYDWYLCNSFWDSACLIPFLILLILGLIIIFLLKKDSTNPIAFGIIWFLICVLPRSSIVSSGELLVDYKTYLASVGWLLVIAYLVNLGINYFSKNPGLVQKIVIVIAIMLLANLTVIRNRVWSSNRNFWHDVIMKAPTKARGFNNYGMALVNEGLHEQAIFYFKKSIELNFKNNHNIFYCDPYQNLANVYAMTNQVDLAINIIKTGLQINPQIADLHNNLGVLLLTKQDFAGSIKHLQLALQLKPNFGQAMYALAKTYLATNQPELAWPLLKKACLETHMDRINAVLQLYAETSIILQKMDDAIFALQKLIARNPKNIHYLFNLGGAYYFSQKYPEAIRCYQQILLLEPNNQMAKEKLAFFDHLAKKF